MAPGITSRDHARPSFLPPLWVEAAEVLLDEAIGLEILDRLRSEPALGRAHVLFLGLAPDRVATYAPEQPIPEPTQRVTVSPRRMSAATACFAHGCTRRGGPT